MKIIIFLLLILPTSMLSQNPEDLKWQKRIILITASNFEDEQLQQQMTLLKKIEDKWDDYKLAIIEQTNEGQRKNVVEINDHELTDPINMFKVSLIGLDGGVKYSSEKVQAAQKFLDLIDSMPMRRAQLNKGE